MTCPWVTLELNKNIKENYDTQYQKQTKKCKGVWPTMTRKGRKDGKARDRLALLVDGESGGPEIFS